MPALTQSIDSLLFDAIFGEVQPRSETIEVISRKGVDGSLIRRVGTRGRPFSLTTWRYTTGGAAGAYTVFDSYLALKTGGGVTVTVNGATYSGSFQVLDVTLAAAKPVASVVGAITASADRLLIANWSLLHF